jgi:hypothetical protein
MTLIMRTMRQQWAVLTVPTLIKVLVRYKDLDKSFLIMFGTTIMNDIINSFPNLKIKQLQNFDISNKIVKDRT